MPPLDGCRQDPVRAPDPRLERTAPNRYIERGRPVLGRPLNGLTLTRECKPAP